MLRAETKRTTGIPFLSRIPILDYLLKSESVEVDEREIVVFIAPTILED